jgi:hypothetical protein
MPKLHQIVAIEKGVKNGCNAAITARYHELQKSTFFSGIARNYKPRAEDGEQFPSERQVVQTRGEDLLSFTSDIMTKYWDMTLTKDTANCEAKADVVVDGKTILSKVPVTFLLFLDKQLGDLATMVRKIPILDPAETWAFDSATNTYATSPSTSFKTKKVKKAFTKAEATDKHPAQVETYDEDVIIGEWSTIKYSGAMPQKRVTEILERIGKLQAAVKFAREEANSISVTEQKLGKTVFGYLLA